MKLLYLCGLYVFVFSQPLRSEIQYPLHCWVDGSNDRFDVYPSQLSYTSDSFSHYQLIEGLTVLVVNNKTMRFNRLSNLNLLPHSTTDPTKPPDRFQLFGGLCEISQSADQNP